MSNNAGERDVARRMGFGRPRPRLSGSPDPAHVAGNGLFEKLGVRLGMLATFVGVTDPQLVHLKARAPVRVSSAGPMRPVDVIIFQAESSFALRRVRELAPFLKNGGALWVLWPRDQSHMTESHVQKAGAVAGLTDVMGVAVSERLAGLKFVQRHQER